MNLGKVFLLLALVALAVAKPSPNAGKKVVCYYGSWAVYRPGDGKFDVENIDPFMCTHIIYGFVGLGSDGKLNVMDSYNDLEENWGKGAMKRFTRLKEQNPELKALVAIGGWNEGSEKYSQMVSTAASRRTFIDSVVEFLPKEGFDGFDLDWEYPAHRGGKPEDRENFDLLMAELRAEFDQRGWLLTAAVSAGEYTIREAYNVPNLARYLDFVNIMSYDFHGAWDFHPFTHHNAPLFEHPMDAANNQSFMNMDHAMKLWNELGLPKEKIIMGLASYGRGFQVSDESNLGLYSPATLGIPAGPFTRESGFWGYNEICEELKSGQWQIIRDEYIQAPYATKGKIWIGYDDVESIAVKASYAVQNDFGGVMVWSLETDDFHGKCGESFPLIKTMYRTMNGDIVTPAPTTTTTTTVDPSAPTEETTTTTTTTTEAPVTGEPGEICKKEGHNPDPNNCQVFYNCHFDGQNWEIIRFECGPGTVFNPLINGCDFPYNVPGCA